VSLLPIGVRAEALHVLVVGAGAIGTRKALSFLGAGASVTVVAPQISDDLRSTSDPRLRLVQAPFDDDHLSGADLVVAATGDSALNQRVASVCAGRHLLCNRADDGEEGTFATMAVHRAGTVVIGVSAGGVPGAAARIRDEIAARFDERYARAVHRLSAMRRSLRESGEWDQVAGSLVDRSFCEAVESGALEERLER
jgi:siroheme synthase-like protein